MLTKLKDALDFALDVLFELTDPVAGDCPVCAMWRGIAIGVIASVVVWLAVAL
jgi:hypothetical protein